LTHLSPFYDGWTVAIYFEDGADSVFRVMFLVHHCSMSTPSSQKSNIWYVFFLIVSNSYNQKTGSKCMHFTTLRVLQILFFCELRASF